MADNKHPPRKRFGQHFLTDQSILKRIVAALDVDDELAGRAPILEIGPGLGALTDGLATALEKHDARLTVVEIDRDLAARLRRRYPVKRVRVIQGDMLNFRLADAITPNTIDRRFRLVGNLPYNIATPLIFHLLDQIEYIHDMLFMLQKEVALRLCAQPGNKNYGRLSVMAALALHCEPLFHVPPEAFDPPPKVDSSMLRLLPKAHPLKPIDRKIFSGIVRAAFNQRRKTLRNALAGLLENEQFIQADIDPTLRAEALSAQQYVELADVVAESK